MSDERSKGILGGLPQTRPHRRSAKRPAAPAVQGTQRAQPKAAAKPAAKPRAQPKPALPPPAAHDGVLGTAVQAAGELAEIGVSVSARALRGLVSRLPRP
jgi:hypothetical protein